MNDLGAVRSEWALAELSVGLCFTHMNESYDLAAVVNSSMLVFGFTLT